MIIIWYPVKDSVISYFGHVSYITMQDDQSWSFQSLDGNWTRNKPSSDYTNDRSKTSAGRGYILDFGSELKNEKFQSALKTFNDYPLGIKRSYGVYGNNCANPFNVAFNAIAGDLGMKKINIVYPERVGTFIRDNLQKYYLASSIFLKH